MTRWTALFAAIVTAATGVLAASSASAATGRVRYVTDGDTFRLESGERIRIANIDAPETHAGQAKCRAEIALGLAATKRVRALLDHQKVTFVRVGRSYNRTVARVTLDGHDLGKTLMTMGAVKPWPHHNPSPIGAGAGVRSSPFRSVWREDPASAPLALRSLSAWRQCGE